MMKKTNKPSSTLKPERPITATRNNTSHLPEPTENLEEYIELLYNHQKTCEKNGKYIEADTAKRRLKEMRDELDRRTKEDMRERHAREVIYQMTQREEIEAAHLNEFNSFNKEWQDRLNEFNEDIKRLEEQTLSRHEDELSGYEAEISKSIPSGPKESPELINLRHIEETLAKQQNYLEAHKVQTRIHELEKQEFTRYTSDRSKKIQNLLNQLRQKQEAELKALRQKIELGIEEKKKFKGLEMQKLLQKYQNVRKELEYMQNQELSKFEKAKKNQSTASLSKMSFSKV